MTHRLLAAYGHPDDPAAFDRYYREVHAPLALTAPGLQRYSYGHCTSADGGQPPFYLVATLDFPSAEAVQEMFASDKGQEILADVPKFATGGVTVTTFDLVEAGPAGG